MTLVEPVDGMRTMSRALNPDCTHHPDGRWRVDRLRPPSTA